MSLRIIQIQVVDRFEEKDKVDTTLYGLGLDGIVYIYGRDEKHWTPITTKRVNPLYKQPAKKLRHQIEGGEEHV